MSNHAQYFGSERRKEQRRQNADRRELIRFELDKDPRRSGHGRRDGDLKDQWTRTGA
jgi:hypothetical protein